jgi:hypothetical protein
MPHTQIKSNGQERCDNEMGLFDLTTADPYHLKYLLLVSWRKKILPTMLLRPITLNMNLLLSRLPERIWSSTSTLRRKPDR